MNFYFTTREGGLLHCAGKFAGWGVSQQMSAKLGLVPAYTLRTSLQSLLAIHIQSRNGRQGDAIGIDIPRHHILVATAGLPIVYRRQQAGA